MKTIGSKAGLFLGALGGIVAFLGLAIYFDPSLNNNTTIATMGIILLLAAMFFAIGGAFTKNGQWTPKAITVFGFLIAAVIVGAALGDIINCYFAVAELIIAILIIAYSYLPGTKFAVKKN